jgi:(S)-mandelate dehydrogenase
VPEFANLLPYADWAPVHRFMQHELGAGFTWEAVARIRNHWKKPLILKGILHPEDARIAAGLRVDGIVVSNHGARQFDLAPAPIDLLPAIRAVVGVQMTVLLDSGIESGGDILKALALGADAVLAGRAFLYGVAARDRAGAQYVAAMLQEELMLAMRQAGLTGLDKARSLTVRHPDAWMP